MNYKNKTLIELKKIAKDKRIKGYSKLNKNDLLKVITKKQKGGNNNNSNNNKIFKFTTNKNLKEAVNLWIENKENARNQYGLISKWDVSNITDMSSLFSERILFNDDISDWDVSNVTNMENMFGRAKSFNQLLNNWDTSKVTNMGYMFTFATSFNQPLNWDTSNVKYMQYMFYYAKEFNQPLNNWNVSNVKYMQYMFYYAKEFNQPLNNWNVSNVTNMHYMFLGAEEFNQPLNGWIVTNETNIRNMFMGTNALINKPEWYLTRSNISNRSPRLIEINNIIKINNNMLKQNTNTNTCNYKLFNKILETNNNLLEYSQFKFTGQTGIDVGGLTRIVYDLFYKSFINKFFKFSEDEDYMLIKDTNIDKDLFFQATEKLIILAKKAEVKILINLNNDVKQLISFTTEEYKKFVNNNGLKNKLKKKISNNEYNLTKQSNLEIIGYDTSNVKLIENNNESNKLNLKNSVHESIYLWILDFRKRKQFNLLLEWYKKFWDDNLFTTKISFAYDDFKKRIKIIKPGNTSDKGINIPNNINTNNLINNNPNLKILLSYIKKSDENREKINAWITGSRYSNALLKIFIENTEMDTPYKVVTCFNYINVYKTKTNYTINALNTQITTDLYKINIQDPRYNI